MLARAISNAFVGYARGLAAWVHGNTITVLRVSDDAHEHVQLPTAGVVRARLSPAGLFYTYRPSSDGMSRLAFMSESQLTPN